MICILLVAGHGTVLETQIKVITGKFKNTANGLAQNTLKVLNNTLSGEQAHLEGHQLCQLQDPNV